MLHGQCAVRRDYPTVSLIEAVESPSADISVKLGVTAGPGAEQRNIPDVDDDVVTCFAGLNVHRHEGKTVQSGRIVMGCQNHTVAD